MSNKHLRSFREQARNVGYAYEDTQRQYDKYPPNSDLVPIATAINAWTLVCGCYMGIEQTMKLLIRMREREPKMGRSGHDLMEGYGQLDPSDRRLVSDYHGVYRSLHNFDTGDISIETADEFIRHMGNGYVAWRYILTEDNKRMPKVHLGMMLESWRALADLVQHSISDDEYPFRTVATHLENYIIKEVFHDAQMDEEWQAASQDETRGVEFREIHDWFFKGRRPLEAGIELFNHLAQGTGDSVEASSLLRQVLLRAADKAVQAVGYHRPSYRREDIAMFHYRINNDGLVWNADKKVFESCPVTGFDQKK